MHIYKHVSTFVPCRATLRRNQPSAAPESPAGEGPSEQLLGLGFLGLAEGIQGFVHCSPRSKKCFGLRV